MAAAGWATGAPCTPLPSGVVRFKRSGPPAGTNDTSDGRRPACAREGEVVDQMGAAGEAHAGFGGRVGRGTQGTEEGLL